MSNTFPHPLPSVLIFVFNFKFLNAGICHPYFLNVIKLAFTICCRWFPHGVFCALNLRPHIDQSFNEYSRCLGYIRYIRYYSRHLNIVVVFQSLSCVRFFVIPWPAAHKAPLSTVSQILLKFMSIELVMLSNDLSLCRPFIFCLQPFPASGSFPMSRLFASDDQSIGISALA